MATIASLEVWIRAKTAAFDKDMKGAARTLKNFQRTADKVARFARNALLVGGGGFILATRAAADFERQLASVSTMLSGAGMAHLESYRIALQDMAAQFGQSTETLSKGLYDILSAVIAPSEAINTLTVATKAAVGGMTDTATSTKAIIRILKSFGLAASQATDVADVLFTIVKRGVITYAELAETIGKVAPSARAAGLSLEELAASIATIVAVEEPARAMTALRMAIFEAAEVGMDLLGFIRKFEGASLEQVIAAGIPKRGAQGVVILANNIKLLDENLAAMNNRAGAAEEAFQKMAGTPAFKFAQMWQTLQVSLQQIGREFLPMALQMAEGIGKIAKSFVATIQRNKEWLLGLAKTAAGILAILYVGSKLTAMLTFLAAHPLVAVVAGLTAMALALREVFRQTSTLHQNIGQLVTQTQQLHEADVARLQQLRALSDQRFRTIEEQQTMNKLAGELTGKYGDLGVVYNELGDAIGVAADAMRRMTLAMREQMRYSLSLELMKAKDNVRALEDEFRKLYQPKGVGVVSGFGRWLWGGLPLKAGKVRELDAARRIANEIGARFKGLGEYAPGGEAAGAAQRVQRVEANAIVVSLEKQLAALGKTRWEMERYKISLAAMTEAQRQYAYSIVNQLELIEKQDEAWAAMLQKTGQMQREFTSMRREIMVLGGETESTMRKFDFLQRYGAGKAYDEFAKLVDVLKTLHERDDLGKWAKDAAESLKTSADIFKEYRERVVGAVKAGLFTRAQGMELLEKRMGDLMTKGAGRGPGEFKTISTQLIDLQSLAGPKGAEAKRDIDRNKLLEKEVAFSRDILAKIEAPLQ